MALHPEHELHRRRSGRNVGLALVLVAFVALLLGSVGASLLWPQKEAE